MRAVIYARYSSDHQREASIEDQIRTCRAFIEDKGWTYLHGYNDRAQSGSSTVLRPGYQRMLEDARAGQFDVIVAEALDRLSRDQADVATLYKQLRFGEIALVTLSEGEIDELHVGLKGTMNALFIKDLPLKTRRGMEGRIRHGKSAGGLAYGYEVVYEAGPDGKPTAGGRQIVLEQAEVICRIFREFAGGKAPRRIAHDLNADGIPFGAKGRAWSDTTIRGSVTRGLGILNNELYRGRRIWNRQRFIKDPVTGKRVSRVNPESEWVIDDVPELRIVSDELWQSVHDRMLAIRRSPGVQKAQENPFWTKRRARHLLTRLVVCNKCGGYFTSVGKNYMACGNARRQGTCTSDRSIPRPDLENIILDGLKERLMAPELVKAFIREVHAEIDRGRDQETQQRAARERELDQVERKLSGLIDAIADGFRAPGLQAKLDALEVEKAVLVHELDAPAPSPVRLHPHLAQVYREQVGGLRDALQDPSLHDEAMTILRSLIERVEMQPTDDGYEITLVGEIAHMISLSPEISGKEADQIPSSVKVVAGVGFEPTTFRL
ncbi:MAG: recombinase family protein [Rhodospirillaceae bacterium]|jgi:site-specific DNA recombinase|nr:recombinase family protein [Rhodospirillaceae bacterium]